MQTDITRQISASVYENTALRDKIYNMLEDPYHAAVSSPGIDDKELIKHVLNARRKERNYTLTLFVPAIIFIYLLYQFYDNPSYASYLLILFIITFFIVASRNLDKENFIKDTFSSSSYNPESFVSKNETEDSIYLDSFRRKVGTNISFYSGYSPFVGSGLDIGGWSFVIDTDKGKKVFDKQLTPMGFQEKELYDFISRELDKLKIAEMAIYDKIYFNGKKIRNNRDLLPDILGCPVNSISPEKMEELKTGNQKDARYYKVLQIVDWEGDITFTSYLRFKKSETTLFVENNYFLLPPISDDLRGIDRIKEDAGFRKWVVSIIKYFFLTFVDTTVSVIKVFGYIIEGINEFLGTDQNSQIKKFVKTSPDFDYGASTSVREAIAQGNYTQHFQKLDKEKYLKIIEKRIFTLLGDFLDTKNIDTSEFKDREASILNHGVIVTGGNLKGQNFAVGQKSNINMFKRKK